MNEFLCVNRVAFNIFGMDVYWYGIIMCSAIIIAIGVACLYCKLKKYGTDMPINIAFVILPFGIMNARLFAVLFDSSLSITEYFNFRTGGLSIIGAIIGGGLALLIYLLIKKDKNPLRHFDVLCVVLILAMAIGRWGNFFNTEVYGQVIDSSSFFARFPFAIEINGIYYQALFFYECCLNLVGFIILSIIFFKVKQSGYVTATYLIYYGIVRTILEPLRQSDYILKLWGMPISLICSVIMIVIGVVVMALCINKSVKMRKTNEQKV